MTSSRAQRFTIYDALEAKGFFDSNPANTFARDVSTGENIYKGPIEYPKMLYHPKGDEEVIRAGEVVVSPLTGPALQNEIRGMVHMVVEDQSAEEAALAAGWHLHPAQAIRVRVEERIEQNPNMTPAEKSRLLAAIPQTTSEDRIRMLEREIARLSALRGDEAARVEQDQQRRTGADLLRAEA